MGLTDPTNRQADRLTDRLTVGPMDGGTERHILSKRSEVALENQAVTEDLTFLP